MKLHYYFLFVVLCTLFSCSKINDRSLLIGKWKIDSIEGVGEKDFENMRSVGFEFRENGRYTFLSTLNKREAGLYSIKGKLLNTKDTTVNNPIEKSVQITKLTQDSLYFIMNNEGKKQALKFSKVK